MLGDVKEILGEKQIYKKQKRKQRKTWWNYEHSSLLLFTEDPAGIAKELC